MSLTIGIDVSKLHLDIASSRDRRTERIGYDSKELRTLVRSLKKQKPERIIVEATAGLERVLVYALADAGLPVILVNALQTRRFAQAMGTLAKTDPIDAHILALYGERLKPTPRLIPDATRRQLILWIARRRQINHMIVAEKNRLHNTPSPLRRSIQAHIRYLDKQLLALDPKIDAMIEQDPQKRLTANILQSVPSVGVVITKTLIIDLPELGSLNPKQIAALVGLAPFSHDSGMRRGKRRVRAGRAPVRTALYLGAMNGARFNPVLKDFYTRLRASGKPPKVAFIAVAHKLLVILNAMVRDQTMWQQAEVRKC